MWISVIIQSQSPQEICTTVLGSLFSLVSIQCPFFINRKFYLGNHTFCHNHDACLCLNSVICFLGITLFQTIFYITLPSFYQQNCFHNISGTQNSHDSFIKWRIVLSTRVLKTFMRHEPFQTLLIEESMCNKVIFVLRAMIFVCELISVH